MIDTHTHKKKRALQNNYVGSEALFSSEKISGSGNVVFSFVYGKFCLIIN